MTTELQVAQDISAEIQAPELQRAAQLVYDRAGGEPVAQICGYSAHSSPAGQWLTISFDWHENTTTRKARYSAVFDRETADQQWTLNEIGFDGEQIRMGQDQPIGFNGYLECETLEQVAAYAASKWAQCTTHAYAIGGVITNRFPPISSGNDGSESGKADFVYEVSIRDLSPRRLPVQRPEPNTLTVGSISSSDNTYSLRITDIGSGRLMTTQADCAGSRLSPNCEGRSRFIRTSPQRPAASRFSASVRTTGISIVTFDTAVRFGREHLHTKTRSGSNRSNYS